jgi:hypothetical protein
MSDNPYPFIGSWQCPMCAGRDFITDVMRPGMLCTACGQETLPDVLEAIASDRDKAALSKAMDAAMDRLDPIGENMNMELKRLDAKMAGALKLDDRADETGPMGRDISCIYDAAYDREGLEPIELPASPPPEPPGEFREDMHTHLVEGNPKHAVGERKPNLNLVPPIAIILMAKVFELGARKYGPYNWRSAAVVRSIYLAAAMRHLLAMEDGQDNDPESGYPHSAHVQACMAIVQDAEAVGGLVDDRPPAGPAADLLKRLGG